MEKFLITGLGNIGSEYAGTRHNIGFEVVDFLAASKDCTFETARYGSICTFNSKGKRITLLKPSTYMNLSGKAVRYYLQEENIKIQNLLVISDDIALPLGKIRIRSKGSAGGHNGLENIATLLNSDNFARLRFGIGNDFPKGMQVEFVLGKWFEEEIPILKEKIKFASEACEQFPLIGIERTMNKYNIK